MNFITAVTYIIIFSFFLGLVLPWWIFVIPCVVAGLFGDFKIAAHSLKPQLKYMGIEQLESIILSIEDYAANQQGIDKLPGLVDTLNEVCNKAMEELKEELSVNNHS